MSRNHYTKDARDIERKQIARQEKELDAVEAKPRGEDTPSPEVPPINKAKERRRARLERNRRYKAKRRSGAADDDQK